jgi:hypothetical protein
MMRYAAIIMLVILGLTVNINQIHAEGNNTDREKIYPENGKKSENITVRRDEASIAKGEKLFAGMCKKCHDAYSTTTVMGPVVFVREMVDGWCRVYIVQENLWVGSKHLS